MTHCTLYFMSLTNNVMSGRAQSMPKHRGTGRMASSACLLLMLCGAPQRLSETMAETGAGRGAAVAGQTRGALPARRLRGVKPASRGDDSSDMGSGGESILGDAEVDALGNNADDVGSDDLIDLVEGSCTRNAAQKLRR